MQVLIMKELINLKENGYTMLSERRPELYKSICE